MTNAQHITVGPFHFTILRVLLLVGVIRVMVRAERIAGGMNGLDWCLLFWGTWLGFSSIFHAPFGEALVFRMGAVYNVFGIYFLIRIFCQSTDDVVRLIKIIGIVLVPVVLEMVNEKLTGRNLFASFGGVPEAVQERSGKLRAQGPFGHPILAGTVGAVCLPLMIGIWNQHRLFAAIGLVSCLGMVAASTSSGPVMSVIFGVFALTLWRWRHLTRQMRIAAVVGYILLDIVMKAPAYFLVARIDLTGGSTGWHRAELLRSAFEHIDEWWFAGTDYTRHWMPTGVSFSENHTDITNHYLFYGVWGGLPLVLIFLGLLWLAFRYAGQCLRARSEAPFVQRFMIWCVGAALFSHAVTCFSVAYFEQSVTFFYINIAALGSLHAVTSDEQGEELTSPFISDSLNGGSEQYIV